MSMFGHKRSGENFKKMNSECCKMLENSRGFTAANFCSPEARGMSPVHWDEPAFIYIDTCVLFIIFIKLDV